MLESANGNVGNKTRKRARQLLVTDKILRKMDERKKYNNPNSQEREQRSVQKIKTKNCIERLTRQRIRGNRAMPRTGDSGQAGANR